MLFFHACGKCGGTINVPYNDHAEASCMACGCEPTLQRVADLYAKARMLQQQRPAATPRRPEPPARSTVTPQRRNQEVDSIIVSVWLRAIVSAYHIGTFDLTQAATGNTMVNAYVQDLIDGGTPDVAPEVLQQVLLGIRNITDKRFEVRDFARLPSEAALAQIRSEGTAWQQAQANQRAGFSPSALTLNRNGAQPAQHPQEEEMPRSPSIPDQDKREIARRFIALRNRKGLTQVEIGRKAGYAAPEGVAVSVVETCRAGEPQVRRVLEGFAKAANLQWQTGWDTAPLLKVLDELEQAIVGSVTQPTAAAIASSPSSTATPRTAPTSTSAGSPTPYRNGSTPHAAAGAAPPIPVRATTAPATAPVVPPMVAATAHPVPPRSAQAGASVPTTFASGPAAPETVQPDSQEEEVPHPEAVVVEEAPPGALARFVLPDLTVDEQGQTYQQVRANRRAGLTAMLRAARDKVIADYAEDLNAALRQVDDDLTDPQ